MKIHSLISLLILLSFSCSAGNKSVPYQQVAQSKYRVRVGAEIFLEQYVDSLAYERLGIVCNQTSVLPDGTHLVDTLLRVGLKITALFGPEHGIRGDISAGETIQNNKDPKTGITVYSLYGKTRKPTPEMLRDVDVLVFDIQDVGARFYTYLSTLAYCIEAAGENHKKIIVLDRPNPINGTSVEGPVLDTTFKSFVGMLPVPIRHGMTIGEMAKMIVGEKWIKSSPDLDMRVVSMKNWARGLWYDKTSLPWIPPSPNMKTLATATVYPGTCLFEATTVTEGRGTEKPFEYIGAPWINNDVLASKLNGAHLDGVVFEPIEFTPQADSAAPSPKFNGEKCGGVFVHVTNRGKFEPVKTALAMLFAIQQDYPEKFFIKRDAFNRLAGMNLLNAKGKLDEHLQFNSIQRGDIAFLLLSMKYRLYKD